MSSIQRAIQVLDHLAHEGALGVRAIAQALSLPVGSTHRLLQDLAAERVIERDTNGEWQLSYRLLEITDRQLDGVRFPKLARPFCESIAQKTRETVNVNVLSGGDSVVCIDKVRGNEGMQLDWRIGSRGPLSCGGGAKAVLAFMSEAQQNRVLQEPVKPYTPYTITDRDKLLAELALIRERGYSVDDQEIVIGVFCVGVPIIDRAGHPVGAISISGPSPKTPGPAILPQVDMLHEASSQVSQRLGYAGPWPPHAQHAGDQV